MHQRHQRRQCARGPFEARILRRIVKRVGGASTRAGKFDGSSRRNVRRRERQNAAAAQLGGFAVRDVDAHDRRRLIRRTCNRSDAAAIQSSQLGEFHVRQVKRARRPAFEIDHRQPIKASFSEARHGSAIP